MSPAAGSVAEGVDFSQKLKSCSPETCAVTHPLTQEKTERRIVGYSEGKCTYIEQMPNGGKMEYAYSDTMRKAVVQYYRDLQKGGAGKSYKIDGKEVTNPLQEALDVGQCKVLGYGER